MDALKHNGIITANGTSKRSTVDYTVNPACFSQDSKPALLVNSIDMGSQLGIPLPVNPVDPNHSLTIHQPSIETKPAKDLIDHLLDMSNFPGAKAEARRNSILSYLGERLHVNTETKAWREFAKYVDGQQQKGEKIETFIAWLLGQDKFQIQYWPPRRMMEMWPQAFIKTESTIPVTYNAEGMPESW